MTLPEHETSIVRQATSQVLERAFRVDEAEDLDAKLAELMRVRDACVSAAITIKAVRDNARAKLLEPIQ